MNYAWEELRRQQELLEALMTGGAPEEARGEDSQRAESGDRAAGDEETPVTLAALTDPLAESSIAGRSPATSIAWTRLRTSGERGAAQTRRQAAAPAAMQRGGAGIGPPDGAVRDGGTEAVIACAAAGNRETANARELSRAVQRDARRYDGEFSIY